MSLLNCAVRPSVMFDVNNRQHREYAAQFIHTGSWSKCPVQFEITADGSGFSLAAVLSTALAKHYAAIEFPALTAVADTNTTVLHIATGTDNRFVAKKQQIGK
jgi:hypothetical protein